MGTEYCHLHLSAGTLPFTRTQFHTTSWFIAYAYSYIFTCTLICMFCGMNSDIPILRLWAFRRKFKWDFWITLWWTHTALATLNTLLLLNCSSSRNSQGSGSYGITQFHSNFLCNIHLSLNPVTNKLLLYISLVGNSRLYCWDFIGSAKYSSSYCEEINNLRILQRYTNSVKNCINSLFKNICETNIYFHNLINLRTYIRWICPIRAH